MFKFLGEAGDSAYTSTGFNSTSIPPIFAFVAFANFTGEVITACPVFAPRFKAHLVGVSNVPAKPNPVPIPAPTLKIVGAPPSSNAC